MSKWIAEFDLEDGDKMPEHMDLNYMGAKIDFHCRPMWIPCSEILPENSNTVLITHKGGVSFGWYNGRYWERGASTKHRLIKTVTAWMPLPKPYKGGEEDV